ncbi:hypothetical protein KIPB_002307, partial [Kipferlia bialata]
VTCNESGDLVHLDMSSFGLEGQLPWQIACLGNLKTLTLDDNTLSAPFSPDLCQMEELRAIHMSRAGVQGALPSCICYMDMLRFLHASDNNLVGPIPQCVEDMTYLRELHLDGNDLEGEVPARIVESDWLDEFKVHDNPKLGCTELDGVYDFVYTCGSEAEGEAEGEAETHSGTVEAEVGGADTASILVDDTQHGAETEAETDSTGIEFEVLEDEAEVDWEHLEVAANLEDL